MPEGMDNSLTVGELTGRVCEWICGMTGEVGGLSSLLGAHINLIED